MPVPQYRTSRMTHYGLVADAGGTNVRFALVDLDGSGDLLTPKKYTSRNFANIEDAASAYLKAQKLDVPPAAAVLSVAGPVKDNAISMTNLGWRFSGQELSSALHIPNVRLINDYEAIARALPVLGKDDLRDIGGVASVEKGERETFAIVGPGTGFGVGGLVRKQGDLTPLVTEGGHADFAPADDVEVELLKVLRRKFGHVSNERILSGPGIVVLHDALTAVEGLPGETLESQEITARALKDPNSFSAKVLSRFCAILGSVAGDVTLVMGARDGLFLAGGILPAVQDFFVKSEFRARFDAKGRFASYMKAIPTQLIVNDDTGMMGAATLLR
jgi:glucokinase